MKKVVILLLVISIVLMPFASSIKNTAKKDISSRLIGDENILITEWEAHKVVEFDSDGNEIWNLSNLENAQDSERLSNGNTLVTVYASQKVIEFDRQGNIVWQKTGLNGPVDAERLENGNTLITEFTPTQRVIEIDNDLNIVWEKSNLSSPFDAERLPNGNTLIAESFPEGRVIEVDVNGNIVWNISDLEGPVDVERLENGNTLITEHIGKQVIEVNSNGDIVWQRTGLLVPKDAERLENGNTIIAECGANRVIEVDSSGSNVWIVSGLEYPVDVELVPYQPPSVEITSPLDNNFYLQGIPLFQLPSNTIIYGPIKIKVNVTSSMGVERVELHVNNKLKKTDYDEPYTFLWAPVLCNRYDIKVIAFDTMGQNDSDEIRVFKWRAHPVIIAFGSMIVLKAALKRIY